MNINPSLVNDFPTLYSQKATVCLLPPSYTQELKLPLSKVLYLTSSGSMGLAKLLCYDYEALLIGAQKVAEALGISSQSRILETLPCYHIGGLSSYLRAFVQGASFIESPFVYGKKGWDAISFYKLASSKKITHVSLVPAQLYDLLEYYPKPWPELQCVLLGGGAWKRGVKDEAYPIQCSYAMSEAGTVALSVDGCIFKKNSHILIRLYGTCLGIHSPSLFKGYIKEGSLIDPTLIEEGKRFFITEDKAMFKDDGFLLLGRSFVIKILGKNLDLLELEQKLSSLVTYPLYCVALPHPRRGYTLHLCSEVPLDKEVLSAINKNLASHEKFTALYVFPLPKSPLGKILREDLKQKLLESDPYWP